MSNMKNIPGKKFDERKDNTDIFEDENKLIKGISEHIGFMLYHTQPDAFDKDVETYLKQFSITRREPQQKEVDGEQLIF